MIEQMALVIMNTLKIKEDKLTQAIVQDYVQEIKKEHLRQYLKDIVEHDDEYILPMVRLATVTKRYRARYKEEYISHAHRLLRKIEEIRKEYNNADELAANVEELGKFFTPFELQVIIRHGGLRLMFDNSYKQENGIKMSMDYLSVRDCMLAVVFNKEFTPRFLYIA